MKCFLPIVAQSRAYLSSVRHKDQVRGKLEFGERKNGTPIEVDLRIRY
jgi:hypothetical protein